MYTKKYIIIIKQIKEQNYKNKKWNSWKKLKNEIIMKPMKSKSKIRDIEK
jgi:hypothetical protein